MEAPSLSLFPLITFSLLCAACGSDSKAAAQVAPGDTTPCTTSSITAGSFTLDFGGNTYGYTVHLPPSYDGTKRMPLVLNWHGLTSNAAQQEVFSGMDRVADAVLDASAGHSPFIVVYPNSPEAQSNTGTPSWNAGTCCNGTGRDDVGFARALVQQLESVACIDTKRVYSTGMSNGAFMSYRLGCEAADVFTAIAPVAGKVGIPSCSPGRGVPVMAFHGTADPLVAYDTGALSGETPAATVPQTIQNWATRDTCKTGPTTTYQVGTVTCQTWSDCLDGATVTLCTAEGEGHCWPGTAFCPFGAYTTDIDASEEIANFFAKFTLK